MPQRSKRFLTKKSLGQNFLTVDWPVVQMLEVLRTWEVSSVLEVGPGPGILTKALLRAGLHVTAVEKDRRLVAELKDDPILQELANDSTEESLGKRSNFVLTEGDILKFDVGQWLRSTNADHPSKESAHGVPLGEKAALVGNIPYNISTPLLLGNLHLLGSLQAGLRGILFMTQFEFARRICATHGNSTYGSLSVFCQLRARCKLEFKVDRRCFRPSPKVDSAMVSLQPRTITIGQRRLEVAERLARTAFMQRRKQLRNSLQTLLGDLPEARIPIDLERRAETLSPDEFLGLADFYLQERGGG